MKNQKIHIIFLFLSIAMPLLASAQIEVHSSGEVTMGGRTVFRKPYDEAYINGGAGGACLYLQHNNLTSWSYAMNSNVFNNLCTSYDMTLDSGSGLFYVSAQGWLYCGGIYTSSDSSLKSHITRLYSPMDKINKLSGYTYNYKHVILDSGVEKGLMFNPDTSLRAGIMAQEVQKVAPYMVKTAKNGKLAVDYMQLIPLLVEGVKQLDSERIVQNNQFNLLQARYNALAQSLDTGSNGNIKGSSDNVSSNTSSSGFVLYQNSPNPFTAQTTIEYALKGTYSAAYIYIFDMSGVLKKTFLLDGSGTVTVKGTDLYPGMFLYSLVVDGKQIDTKRMVLTN